MRRQHRVDVIDHGSYQRDSVDVAVSTDVTCAVLRLFIINAWFIALAIIRSRSVCMSVGLLNEIKLLVLLG